jgi:superfamily I DNA/RNA helicase/predicted amidophosphoribosyltransferase
MLLNDIRREPLKYVEGDYFLVHRFPPLAPYCDAFTGFIQKFKDGEELQIKAWASLLNSQLTQAGCFDAVLRVLGHEETEASSDHPLNTLCEQVSTGLDIKFYPAALKKRKTSKSFSQEKLNKAERRSELEGNYVFDATGIPSSSNILLVDDVTTSGSTADVISKTIKTILPDAKITFIALGQTTNQEFSGYRDNKHLPLEEFESLLAIEPVEQLTVEQRQAVKSHQIVFTKQANTYLDSLDEKQIFDTEKAIAQLLVDPRGGGLKPHKVKRVDHDVWEIYLTRGDRLIYEREGDKLIIWKIGSHKIIDRITNKKQGNQFFLDTEFFTHEFFDQKPEAEQQPDYFHNSYQVQANGENPFAEFPDSYLRIVGVPASVVNAVKNAPSVDALENIPALPKIAYDRLVQLYLEPEFEDVLFNPSELIFRTTLDRLEGYIEGRIKKLMINLDEGQQSYVDKDISSPYLLKGCAGSGKTTIGIHKAIQRASEGKRVAYFTFNSNLADVSEQLITELSGPLPENLHVSTLDAFASQILQNPQKMPDPRREDLIEQAIRVVSKNETHPILGRGTQFFNDEIKHVIQGYGLTKKDQYLRITRFGRKSGLQKKSREIVWSVYSEYTRAKEKTGFLDWSDLSTKARQKVKFGEIQIHPFDHIIIDETQDMAPIQIRFAQSLLKSSTDSFIFCMADAGQSIYANGLPWKSAGLEIAGKTRILTRNYRNTKEIALFAKDILSQNTELISSKEYIPPDSTDRHGPKPELYLTEKANDYEEIYNKLMDLISDETFRLSDFAVICRTNSQIREFENFFHKKKIPVITAKDRPFRVLDEGIKLLTIHKAKGLEFPVVFMPSINAQTFPYPVKYDMDRAERMEHEAQDLLLLYVGVTRAADALFLYKGDGRISPYIDMDNQRLRIVNATK